MSNRVENKLVWVVFIFSIFVFSCSKGEPDIVDRSHETVAKWVAEDIINSLGGIVEESSNGFDKTTMILNLGSQYSDFSSFRIAFDNWENQYETLNYDTRWFGDQNPGTTLMLEGNPNFLLTFVYPEHGRGRLIVVAKEWDR